MSYRIFFILLFPFHSFAVDGLLVGKNLERAVADGEFKSRKTEGYTRTKCIIENLSSSKTLSFSWLSFDGLEAEKTVLEPGEKTSVNTYTGHAFAFRDGNHELFMMFVIPTNGQETHVVLVNQESELLACLPGFVDLKEQRESVAEVDKLFLGRDYRLQDQNLDTAFEEFNRLARTGNDYAVHRIGESYLYNKSLPFSTRIEKALKGLREGAAKQISDSWVDLAIIYLSGFFRKGDFGVVHEARFLAQCAGMESFPKAQLLRAYSIFQGYYVGKTGMQDGAVCREAFGIYMNSVEKLKLSMVAKRRVALRHLSLMKERETPFDVSKEKWIELLKRAKEGDPIASFEVGQSYMFGEQGAPQDYKLAVKYLLVSSEHGNGGASRHLGFLYWRGLGVKPASPKRGFRYYKKAVEQGDIEAHTTLSYMLENGIGVRKNLHQAIDHSSIAAKHGLYEGQYQLAQFYAFGLGFKKNMEKAKEYYMLAAEQDHIDSQYEVALLLKNEGSGDEPGPDWNCLEGLYWMKRAAEQ